MIIDKTKTDLFNEGEISIIYDNGCPVCSYYISISKIKTKFGKVNLIKARENYKVLEYLSAAKININEGMIVVYKNKLYFGADAVNIISILGEKSSIINSLIINIFKNKSISKITYPFLKIGRRILLFILGKKLI